MEETISKVDKEGDLKALERVVEMVGEPFKGYGEVDVTSEACVAAEEEERERERLCGVGSTEMLGFQCSCSS